MLEVKLLSLLTCWYH